MREAYICYAESKLARTHDAPYTPRNTTHSSKEFAMSLLSFALPLASAVACVVLRVYLAVNSADDGAMLEGVRG